MKNGDLEKKEIKLKVPATIANIVCGFDILGMAINEPYDEMTIRLTKRPKIVIRHKDNFGLPENPDENVAGVSLKALMEQLKTPVGFEIDIKKNILPGSGLGSSAASSMGAVAAANLLLGKPFSDEELLSFAKEGERLASGAGHYDNIAPCLYGGITLINPFHQLKVSPISYPPLWCSVIHPQIEVKTSDSRKIIKKEIRVSTATRQWANIAGLITGFFNKDYDLISQSLEDVIFEPARSILIPDFQEMKRKSIEAGALGGGISGSGPSTFMLSKDKATATKVLAEMERVYDNMKLPYKSYVTTIKSTRLA